MFLLPPVSSSGRSAWIAAAFCGISVSVLAVCAKEGPSVSAVGERNLYDLDMDGLNDVLEQVIGTEPDRSDSDGDGYSDVEEYARASDPKLATSVPEPCEYSMALGASQDGDTMTMLATVYAAASKIGALKLEFGVVHNGQLLRFYPRTFGAPRGFRVQPHETGARITVVEFPMPVALVRRVGQVNVVSLLRDVSPNGGEPLLSMMPLVNFDGIVARVEQTPAASYNNSGSDRPAGIVYRPLAGDRDLPSTWNPGEICFQRTAAVGFNGVSIVHEIEASSCLPMDTYCSPAGCSAAVGRSIDLPDPAALLGG